MLISFGGAIGGGSWDSATCAYVIPAGLRPVVGLNTCCVVDNGQTARRLCVGADGKIVVSNTGGTGSSQTCRGTICYPVIG